MAFQHLTNDSLQKTREDYLTRLSEKGFRPQFETIRSQDACGRITAEPIYARMSAPREDASAMDGVALRASLTFGAGDTTPITLEPGQYYAVDTGDPIPDDCDAVVMTEDLVKDKSGLITLSKAAVPWQNIRQTGEDICAGEMLLPSGSAVSPSAVGAMLTSGVDKLKVIRSLTVGMVSISELREKEIKKSASADSPEPNAEVFSAMLRGWGAQAKIYPTVPNQEERVCDAVKRAVGECDIVILNAGSVASGTDCSFDVIEKLGEVFCRGIAMKPGKPAILGFCGAKPILGVPRYPVSGIMVIEQFLRPMIELWNRMSFAPYDYTQAVLSRSIVSSLHYQEFIRVRAGKVGDRIIATPLNRGSSVVSSFVKADGVLEVPPEVDRMEAGSAVKVRLLRPLQEVEHTLVAIGSHDPLLDELADIFHSVAPDLFMASSHVGSMGGIMAIRRKEAHIAGIHLLNEADGSYNTAFVRKYFPRGGVRLVECVGRRQGFMLQRGNPRKISEIKDLTREDVRYINRQKGSGTRILFDYLLRREEISTSEIRGYDQTEFTHMSVAKRIAAGMADVGMGVYSAAKLNGLSFLPVCVEQYDLLISDEAWEMPIVQKLIKVMSGEQFCRRVKMLGGYTLNNPGSVRKRF